MKIVISFVVVSSIFCTVSAQSGSGRPQITGAILPEVKQKGQTGYLNCTAIQLSSQASVQWIKNTGPTGDPVLVSSGTSIKNNYYVDGRWKYDVAESYITSTAATYRLIINSLTEVDSGNYTCQIQINNLVYTEWPKKNGLLTVQIAPSIDSKSASSISVDAGGNITLKCEASGIPAPNVTWIRGDGEKLPDGGFRHRGGLYHISGINFTDRGQFICIADNNVKPPAEYKVQVRVRFSPFCKAIQDTVGQKQNFDAKLECEVSANPDAVVIWYQENKETKTLQQINDNDVYKLNQQYSPTLKSDEKWYTLTIMNVQSGHYTYYYCSAANQYGDFKARFKVYETMECQGQNCPSIGAGRGTPVCHLSTAAFVFSLIACIITNKHFRNLF